MKTEHKTLDSGALGVRQLIFLVIATVSPMTVVFGLFPLSMNFGNGIGVSGIYIFIAAIWLFYSVGYTNMARYVRNTGSFYAYIAQGLGRPFGISSSYIALLAYNSFLISNAGFIGYAVNNLLHSHFGINIDWWVYSLIALILIGFIGYRHLEVGTKILSILMFMEIGILLLLSIVALFNPSPEGFTTAPYNPHVIFSGSFGIALAFCFQSFMGFEATSVFSEEVKNPYRSVPLATYWTVIVLGVFYVLVSYAIIVGWGKHGLIIKLNEAFGPNGDPSSIFKDLANQLLGGWSGSVFQILLITSVFAATLSMQSVTTRYFLSCGRTNLLPKMIAKVHPKFGSPYVANVFQSLLTISFIIVTAIVGLDPYVQVMGWFGGFGAITLLLLYSLTSIAIIGFFLRTKMDTRVWHTKIAPGIASIGLIGGTTLTFLHFDLLFGEGQTLLVSVMLLSILFLGILGIIIGLWFRKNQPELYEQIGSSIAQSEESLSNSEMKNLETAVSKSDM
ncbi:hypothetical protein ABD68_19360 [Bacillus endophyticus]|uniref:APC family permease n=1 Tax=Priestia endophytica TaxID=135735 RepID=UPI0018CCAE6A|nr:APC family permease [Priestia endophytica]MBG9813652.1 hypothetical protein [Priestia endophytica]